MRTVEDNFDYQVEQMIEKYIDDMVYVEEYDDNNNDINDLIWENAEEFGRIAIEKIWEYAGDEFVNEIAEKILQKKRDEITE